MDILTPLVRAKIGNHLPAGGEPRIALLNSCSKTGEAGESWLIATDSHLLVGSQSLTGEMEFEAYPLKDITGVERDTHGLGRGRLLFLSGEEVVDQLEYSALDSDKFQTVDHDLLALVRNAGGRPTHPSAPDKASEQAVQRPPAIPPPAPPEKVPVVRPPSLERPPPPARPPSAEEKPAAPPTPRAKAGETPKTPPLRTTRRRPRARAVRPAEPPVKEKVPRPAPVKKKPLAPLRSVGGQGSPNMIILLPSTKLNPGEVVPTSIRLRQNRQVSCRGVRLHLRGLEQTKITHGSGNNRRTSRERHILVDEEHVLFGQRSQPLGEEFADALSGLFSSKKYPTLPLGNHEWETNLFLPQGILPSYEGRHGSVEYSLKAYVDIPLGFDVTKQVKLLVFPEEEQRKLRLVSRQQRRGGIFRLAGTTPDLFLETEVNEFTWGKESKISGRVRFKNPRRRDIRGLGVNATLVEEATAGSYTRRTKIAEKKAYSRLSTNDEEFGWRGFSVPVPRGGFPFEGHFVRVDLILSVFLDLSWRKNAVVEFVAKPVR